VARVAELLAAWAALPLAVAGWPAVTVRRDMRRYSWGTLDLALRELGKPRLISMYYRTPL
jgi:hypothetical protein